MKAFDSRDGRNNDSTLQITLNCRAKSRQPTNCCEDHIYIEDESKPHSFRRTLKQTLPASKRRRSTDLSLETLQGIVRDDAGAASRQLALFTEEKVYNYLSHHLETKRIRESYTYPLSMAFEKGFNATVIKSLIDADKTIMARKDGLEQEGSLHILLKQQGNNTTTVDAILVANPSSVQVEDRHFNTPLHVACRSGASMHVIRHIWVMYPGALAKRNFQGLTPLDVARTNAHMCSDEVAYFLWQKVQE